MRRSGHRGGVLGLVAVCLLGWLVVPAVPAAADHEPSPESHDAAGAGSLEGTELVGDQTGFPCFRMARSVFGIRGGGTYEGRTASGGRVVYRGQIGAGETLHANGPLQVQIENTEAYYHSPFGTHGTEAGGGAGCSPSTVATPVPAEFRVFAAEGTLDTDGDNDVDALTGAAWVYRLNETGEKVPCRAQGSFARGTKESPAFGDTRWVAEWTLGEDCVVVGNEAGTPGTGLAPRGTFFTQHGVHEPCFGDISAGDCPRIMRSEYKQFLAKAGPFLTLTGPDSAGVGCDRPLTVNARLTVDGLAQANAPVTFSVAGPAPAAPPAGAGVTGADGRAGFTFSAGQAGDYVVTAKVTSNGQERVATHPVRFSELPPLSVTVAGPARGQTEDPTVVRATVRDACGALPGATVSFSVAWTPQDRPWTGTTSPSSGSGTTDATGEASFSFTGDRAGTYAVTASTSLGTAQATATHTVDLAINTLKRLGSAPLGEGKTTPRVSAIDPTGTYAYFIPDLGAQEIVKFDLRTFQPVAVLPSRGVGFLVISPDGTRAYGGKIGVIEELDLTTFQWGRTITLPARRDDGTPASVKSGVLDPAGRYGYFGINGNNVSDPATWYPPQVVKVDLATFAVVDSIDMELGTEATQGPALIDRSGAAAYFTFQGGGTSSARVVKIDLGTFRRGATAVLSGKEEGFIGSAVIDPAGDFAYIGTKFNFNSPSRVVKVNLESMTRVGAITLVEDRRPLGTYPVDRNEAELLVGLMDPAGRFAYFGTQGVFRDPHPASRDVPVRLIRIDLATFQRAESVDLPAATENVSKTAVIDPSGRYAYLGASKADTVRSYGAPPPPGLVAKIALDRPPNPALTADADAYTTGNATALVVPAPGVLDGDTHAAGRPMVAGQASDPAGGSVVLGPDGSFTYTPDAGFSGTVTFTYTASDGADYSAPATVSVTVAPPAAPPVRGDAYGYFTKVSLFGGPANELGPTPKATLPLAGSVTPVTASAPTATAKYGPATIFSSGPLQVSSQGTGGPGGSVTTSANLATINTSGQEVFTADSAASRCTASASGVTGTTTIRGGTLRTSEGDPDVAGDDTIITVPVNPAPNTVYNGVIEAVGDSFTYTFNEQVINPDGSITVYAAHQKLLGPTAVGDLYIGKSECGVTASGPPPVVLSVADVSVAEGNSGLTPVTFTVTRSGNTTGASTVKYRTNGGSATPGSDYTAVPLTTLTFAAGETSKAVTVKVNGDTTPEPNENINLVLSAPTTAVIGDAVGRGTIVNDDSPPTLAVNDVSVNEGNTGLTPVTFTVTRSGNTTGASTVKYTTNGGSATPGSDYTAVPLTTLTFAAGQTAKTVTVNVNGDTTPEPNENINLVLSAPTTAVIGDAVGRGTILNDDSPPTLAVNDVSVNEGNTGLTPVTFTVTRSGNTTGASTVKYRTNGGSATPGSDYTAVPLTTLTFAAGETSKTVTVNVNGDTTPEPNENINLVLSAPTTAVIGDAVGRGTILNDDT